jgi:F-type H+-transporting ATPase subunit b
MKILLSLFIILLSNVVLAESGGHGASHAGHTEGIPSVVYLQAINVLIIVLTMFIFLKNDVVSFFKFKKEAYLSAANKAEALLKKANEDHEEIRVKLMKLETSSEESLAKAKKDAELMHKNLISEAEALSKKIKEEAALTAQLEIEKAKNHLRQQMISDSMKSAKKLIEDKAGKAEQEQLQKSFQNQIGAVRT